MSGTFIRFPTLAERRIVMLMRTDGQGKVACVTSEHEGQPTSNETLKRTAEIVASYAANNTLPPEALGELIRATHQALQNLDRPTPAPSAAVERQKPAAPISRSVQHDYLICLEDGKKLTMLKRYLRSRYDMSPEDYRRKWGLSADYPMVAPAYATRRSDFAKSIGLGKGVRRKAK